MAKGKKKRLKKKNDLDVLDSLPNSRRRSTRKVVNYAENNDEENSEHSDSDFEPIKAKKNIKTSDDFEEKKVKLEKKSQSKTQKTKQISTIVKPFTEISKDFQTSNIINLSVCANLSDDGSSSEDDEPLSVVKSSLFPRASETNKVLSQTTDNTIEIFHSLSKVEQALDLHQDGNSQCLNELKKRKAKFSDSTEPKTKVLKIEGRRKSMRKIPDKVSKNQLKTSANEVSEIMPIDPEAQSKVIKENSLKKRFNNSKVSNMAFESDASSLSESEEENWEEVDEAQIKPRSKKKLKKEDDIMIKDLEISVEVSSIHKKKLTKQEKYHNWVRQLIGRFQRELQQLVHKAHLLCLLACEIKRNFFCSRQSVQAICFSLVPMEFTNTSVRKWDISHLRKFTEWFQKEIPSVEELLLFTNKATQVLKYMQREYVLVIMLRSLGLLTRIICSLQPCTYKISSPKLPTESNGTTVSKVIDSQKSEISPYFANNTKLNEPDILSQIKSPNKPSTSKTNKNTLKTSDTLNNTNEVKKTKRTESQKKQERKSHVPPKEANKRSKRKKSKSSEDESPKQISNKKSRPQPLTFKKGADVWLEVYLHTMQKWICIELTGETINEPDKCELHATKPLQYVIGIDNNHRIKDLTCRYAAKWLSYNIKLRIGRDWWLQTLAPYKPAPSTIDSAEDAQLKKNLLDQDFPKSISDFKDNPLYALKRHLLKFEAIYPESAVPLGYIRNEAIYSRDCVRELHTRETWMKQARVVKTGETPYKIVKGRPKRNTPVFERENVKVEVFGEWQTEDYIPPPVVNGIVPKNAYGNVELFKPCMLPEGAIHLPIANMQKIARKLKIDHAPAMMGWDFHGGFSHPVFEGIVVAKEHEDMLLDAWRKEEEIIEKKEKEKREKIIYDNWRLLIKGLLIQHKLKMKYNFEDDHKDPVIKKQPAKNSKRKKNEVLKKDEYTDLSVSWPMNRMEGKSSLQDDGHAHVFQEVTNNKNTDEQVKLCSCGLTMPVDKIESL